VLRFANNSRPTSRDTRVLGPLTTKECRTAERFWIRAQQQQSYGDVINKLRIKKHGQSIIRQLRLYLDDDGCIRSAGRINNAHLPEATKFTLLLPPKAHLTRLIINDAHIRQLHAGIPQTVTLLHQKFWIPSIRQSVGHIVHHCVNCRKITGKSYTAPVLPPLPASRVTDARPFTVTGVDYSGALHVMTDRRQQQKVYICLFTCANTRAVHLEIVPDLTEDSFLLAFRRFVSRRSLPRLRISDNATTFHAAATHIERLYSSPMVGAPRRSY